MTGKTHVRGDFEGGTLEAAVAAPVGSLLLAARYDASGRQDGVKVIEIEAEQTVCGVEWTRQDGYAYKLMLVNGKTLAPLCEAWSSQSRK